MPWRTAWVPILELHHIDTPDWLKVPGMPANAYGLDVNPHSPIPMKYFHSAPCQLDPSLPNYGHPAGSCGPILVDLPDHATYRHEIKPEDVPLFDRALHAAIKHSDIHPRTPYLVEQMVDLAFDSHKIEALTPHGKASLGRTLKQMRRRGLIRAAAVRIARKFEIPPGDYDRS